MAERQNTFVGNVLKLTTGAAIAQGIAVLASPVIARLYEPKAFGIAAVFGSITGIIGVIVCFRYELSIMLPRKNDEASSLLWGSIFFVVIITGLSALTVVFWRSQIAQFFKMPDLTLYLWLVPPTLFVGGIFLTLNYWSSRMEKFGHLSAAQVVSSGTRTVVRLGIGVSEHASAGGLILGKVVGSVIATGFLARRVWKDSRYLLLQGIHLSKIVKGLKEYRKFPLFSTWSALLNTTSRRLPPFLLAFFFSPTVVGFYALGHGLINLPMGLLGRAIAQVFYQQAAEAQRTGNLAKVVEAVFRRLVSIGIFPIFLLTLIGKEAFIVVLGKSWAEAGVYVQILGTWMFLVFLSSPISALVSVLGKQAQGLLLSIILFITRLISLVLGGVMGNARIALAFFAGTGFIISFWKCFWLLSSVGIPKSRALYYLGKYISYSMPIMGIVALAKWVLKFNPSGILLVGCLGTVLYYTLIIWEDKTLRENIQRLVRQRKGSC